MHPLLPETQQHLKQQTGKVQKAVRQQVKEKQQSNETDILSVKRIRESLTQGQEHECTTGQEVCLRLVLLCVGSIVPVMQNVTRHNRRPFFPDTDFSYLSVV